MQDNVLSRYRNINLKVYAIWMPILNNDTLERVDPTMLFDRRVIRYWDENMASGLYFRRLPEWEDYSDFVVWDAYALYPETARWETGPDTPDFGAPGPVIDNGSTIIERDEILAFRFEILASQSWKRINLPMVGQRY